tara:strand:+ start:1032 stop:1271 length:240 start_codon:yes stop_codon:yes gene_type:complete
MNQHTIFIHNGQRVPNPHAQRRRPIIDVTAEVEIGPSAIEMMEMREKEVKDVKSSEPVKKKCGRPKGSKNKPKKILKTA